MNTIIASIALAAILLPAQAAQPAAPQSAAKGRVLVLENEQTLTGDIEFVEGQYRVRRLIGETWVPASRVLKLCASLEEAHVYLQGRSNLNDPDERRRLAEWCRQHGLKAQAIAELEEAVRMSPDHGPSKRMLAYLKETLAKPAASAKPIAPPKPIAKVDLTADALGLFASRVQPILMNTCACCHATGRGGNFQITRVYSHGLTNRQSLEMNVAAVLAQVNTADPTMSKFLTKAVSIHAASMTQAPIRNRHSPAYKALAKWLDLTLENNPHLRVSLNPSSSSSPLPSSARADVSWGQDRGGKIPPPPIVEKAPTVMPTQAKAPEKPIMPPKVPDPVDPEAFNKEFHPEQKPGEK